jgi:hypothetical protein
MFSVLLQRWRGITPGSRVKPGKSKETREIERNKGIRKKQEEFERDKGNRKKL